MIKTLKDTETLLSLDIIGNCEKVNQPKSTTKIEDGQEINLTIERSKKILNIICEK